MNAKFWLLESPHVDTRIVTSTPYERVTCAAGHVSARQSKFGDLAVKLPHRSLYDFESTWDSRLVISERALQVLERHHVTGFDVRPITARYRMPISAEPYPLFELAVTGWGGIAARAAGVRLVAACRACKHREYTIADPTRVIDPSAWDGSDLFIVWPLPGFPFASDRLAKILRRECVSGVELLPPSRISVKPGATLSPGPLDSLMPEARAFEIGKHFDVLEG